ncbi:MAG TPA: hypothetical protein VHJ78_11820, partial [Actinomycetota bacterium]|nr:hypothetical protein [Actinomycetota bacterium]
APGGTFTFTVVVANTGTVPVVITAMTDNVYGNLATLGGANSCDDLIGDTIGAGASSPACSFQGSFTGAAGDSQTDIVTVTAVDAAGNLAGGTDDATVSIGPAPPPEVPSISVEVTPSPSSIDEPGGPVTYRVVITNTSNPISLTITSLTDSVLGNIAALPEPNTCDSVIGMTLGPGESVTCEFTVQLTADADQDRSSIVTVTALASTGQTVSDSSPTVTVEVRDVVPRISVEKEASPESRPEPGGRFTFRVSITNEEEEPVVLTTLGDDMYGDLNGDGTCDTGATIAGGGTYSCEFSVQFTGEDGDRQTDTVIATVVDDEGNAVTETARATIRLTDPVAAAPATPTPTASPTPTTSPTPTASPTASPTPSPSASPTSSPTPSPSASPTAAPSPVPSPPAPGSISRTGIDSLGWFALSLALIAAGFLLRNAAPPGRRTLR